MKARIRIIWLKPNYVAFQPINDAGAVYLQCFLRLPEKPNRYQYYRQLR